MNKEEIIAQIVVLLLESEPDPEQGYYGLAIEAADQAYRIYRGKHDGSSTLAAPQRP